MAIGIKRTNIALGENQGHSIAKGISHQERTMDTLLQQVKIANIAVPTMLGSTVHITTSPSCLGIPQKNFVEFWEFFLRRKPHKRM
jgi:hypothetical protein